MTRYAIKVVWADGDEEYLKLGQSRVPAVFPNRQRAKEQADFMLMGMDQGECQSINVVPYPKKGSKE